MGKFTIKNIEDTSYIPEDNGWVWVRESVSEPIPKYKYASLGMSNGYVDLSLAASSSVLYESRTITVTFARFKHGADGWQDDAEATADAIRNIFLGNVAYLYPKTISTKRFTTNGFNYEVSRDGIIQYLTFTFKCQPIGTQITS